jgi:hypothetical protein
MKKVCKSSAVVGMTLRKKTGNFELLEQKINNFFRVVKRIDLDSSKDVIFICRIK